MGQLDFFGAMGADERISTDIYDFVSALFSTEESNAYMNQLIAEVPWEQTSMLIDGKRVVTPRLTAWIGDQDSDYSIKGSQTRPLAWRMDLLDIKRRVEQTAGINFNGVLLNYYRDGSDSVSRIAKSKKVILPRVNLTFWVLREENNRGT